MKKFLFTLLPLFLLVVGVQAQKEALPLKDSGDDDIFQVKIGDEWMYAIVTDGDTLYMADLDGTSVTMPREFENLDEKRYYYKIKRSAEKVYPYAVTAITLYNETLEEIEGKKKRQRKKITKKKGKQLKEDFEAPLKKLTKTQGRVLIAMIERELDVSFFDVLKELRGGMAASYWNTLGKMYGYKLKEKYDPEDDPIMEAVLSDYDIN